MSPRRKRHDDLKSACIDEALKIVDEEGLDKLSLREVARRLGVSHGAPYKHFPSRDHILAEMVSRAYKNFSEYLEARPKSRSAHQDLTNMGVAYIEYAFSHRLQYGLMFDTGLPDPESHPEMLANAKYTFALLQSGVEAVHVEMEGPGPHATTDHDALFIWSALHGTVGTMQSDAMRTVDISKRKMQQAVPEIMARMGRGVFGDDAPPVSRKRTKLPT